LEKDFIQRLIERQPDIDRAVASYVARQTAQEVREIASRQTDGSQSAAEWLAFIKLSALRQRLGLVYGEPVRRSEQVSEVERHQLESDVDLLKDIFAEAKAQVNKWNGKLYFVYLPTWSRYSGEAGRVEERLNLERSQILTLVSTLGLPVIDLVPTVANETDPLSLFPFHGPGHYNEAGHRLIAETVLDVISRVSSQALPGVSN